MALADRGRGARAPVAATYGAGDRSPVIRTADEADTGRECSDRAVVAASRVMGAGFGRLCVATVAPLNRGTESVAERTEGVLG